MKVFLSVSSLKSSYGGPARSVSRLGIELARHGVRLGLWAPDGSASGFSLPRGSEVQLLDGNLEQALARFGRPDLIHDNGIWMPHNHALAVQARKLRIARVVSSRGMLESWAVRHRWLKKRIAWNLYQRSDLKRASGIHVTSAQEQGTLERLGFPASLVMIPNGIDCPVPPTPGTAAHGSIKTALFVGRLHPVKGLPMLLEAWAKLQPVTWKLRLVGPDENDHRRELEALVVKHGLAGQVEFAGSLVGEKLYDAYREASLFVLSSHTENFGMAVGEALSFGLPVIATRGTPWQVLEERDCGWWVETSREGLLDGLSQAIALPGPDLAAMGGRGRKLAEERFEWKAIATAFVAFYQQQLS